MAVATLTELQSRIIDSQDIQKGMYQFSSKIKMYLISSMFYENIFPCRFAYIEFSERESVRTAMTLDETLFRGRVIKVRWKCTAMGYGYALHGNEAPQLDVAQISFGVDRVNRKISC